MTTLTVSQINRYIKSLFDEIPPIQNIYVMGEISNFKHYRQSGHMYFTLKDSSSQLKWLLTQQLSLVSHLVHFTLPF